MHGDNPMPHDIAEARNQGQGGMIGVRLDMDARMALYADMA